MKSKDKVQTDIEIDRLKDILFPKKSKKVNL